MHALDWTVVWIYFRLMLLALYLTAGNRPQTTILLAAIVYQQHVSCLNYRYQCSTNSLLGAPAFVGFVVGGGMIWLQYELAVPRLCWHCFGSCCQQGVTV